MSKIIIASGPVIVEDNKVLLNKSGEDIFWKFCGGKIKDLDAGLFATARRKAKEEMGIDIEIVNEEPFIIHTTKNLPDGKIDIILVHYLAKRIGEIKPGEGVREWNWYDINNLPDDLAPNILPVLKHFKFL